MNNLLQNCRKQAWLLAFMLMLLSLLVIAAPVPQGKTTGEAWASGTVAVNGKAAATGMTVSTGSRIEAGLDGLLAINLGKTGRVAVQADTNFLLNFQEGSITGDLAIGNIVINIANGTTVQVKTPHGEVTVPLEQTPATLTVSVSTDGTSAFIRREADRPRAFRSGSNSTPLYPGSDPIIAKTGKAVGEVLAVGNASINGNLARSGATILTGSRIETGADGLVALSLNRAGRVAVQAGTNFLQNFQEDSIAGELTQGTVIINLTNATTARVKTPDVEARVLLEQSPATMTVGVATDGTHVFIRRDQDRPRSLTPAPIAGWVLPSLQAAVIGGVVTTLTTILPDPSNVTTVVPGIIFLF